MDPAFAEWAKDVILLCHVTTQVAGDPHQDLLQKKGGRGFPHLVFMDPEGEVIATVSGPRTVAGFRESGAKAIAFLDLRKRAAGGDKAAAFDLIQLRVQMGALDAAAFEKEILALGPLSKEQEAKLAPVRANLEVRSTMSTVRDRATQIAAGETFLKMKEDGRIPEGEQEIQPFWMLIMGVADDRKDAALFEEGVNALKARFAGRPGTEAFFQQAEKKLESLKAAKP